ncbi:hypothetical protein F2P81_012525 [Scophthalmus maximus]|uniref:Uncharacterized protein n=1 Tax=Scophthalmus maximus TaxID=52904 RepID=A0A6A4SNH0_SCOMX|nr:hypothetical protein F2P81_012525 [Scophthalmus maximus]
MIDADAYGPVAVDKKERYMTRSHRILALFDSSTFIVFTVILLDVILLDVILLDVDVILLDVILLDVILLDVILLDVILLDVILLDVILLDVILLDVILLDVILLDVILLDVILLDVILLDVILLDVILLDVILLDVSLASMSVLFPLCVFFHRNNTGLRLMLTKFHHKPASRSSQSRTPTDGWFACEVQKRIGQKQIMSSVRPAADGFLPVFHLRICKTPLNVERWTKATFWNGRILRGKATMLRINSGITVILDKH